MDNINKLTGTANDQIKKVSLKINLLKKEYPDAVNYRPQGIL